MAQSQHENIKCLVTKLSVQGLRPPLKCYRCFLSTNDFITFLTQRYSIHDGFSHFKWCNMLGRYNSHLVGKFSCMAPSRTIHLYGGLLLGPRTPCATSLLPQLTSVCTIDIEVGLHHPLVSSWMGHPWVFATKKRLPFTKSPCEHMRTPLRD